MTLLLEGAVMAGPGPEMTAAGRGHLRASHADRDQTLETLKAAFAQGRLTKDELDARIGRTLVARTYADLAAATAGIAAGRPGTLPVRAPSRRHVSNLVRWGVSGFMTPAILAAAFALASLRGGSGYGAVAFVGAFVYFVFWLSAGADMLWQWYSMSVPTARMCVRCAHTAAAHRAPESCSVRLGSLKSSRCGCAGYVPPGVSPKAADLRLVSTR